eukprot:TRINITY_DN532_c0_g1_i1.p1 TRINITY_DN532_c0_g1~~TRINITY_DN532_c0_g1_i1.p1  ORF type:complete len:213 (-),score=42.04 TRINITY_DN532_c0_g1_i1:2108-2746(-)
MDSHELKNIDQAVEPIHPAVLEFADAVAEEYIVHPVERKKEKKAREAIQTFRNACVDAMEAIAKWEDKERANLVKKAILVAKQENQNDILLYEKTLVKYYNRKIQYDKCNALTRNLLSPRSKSREKVWDEEDVVTYPEMNCMMLSFIIFGLLLVGWMLAHFGVGKLEDMRRRYAQLGTVPSVKNECDVFGFCNLSSVVKTAVSVEDFDKMEL